MLAEGGRTSYYIDMTEEIKPVRGVNLGGWLVLEKWMTPSLFTGIKGPDEFCFCEELGNRAGEILKIHRDNFITEKDFKWIADRGLNAIRLPVGYWVCGGSKPFIGGIEYVDLALDWAEKYGLKVILDLHGAPGSQNGNDHSGRVGKIRWHKDDNIDQTLQVLERLCQRYAGVPALLGIELLNEPSYKLGKKLLTSYYEQAYELVRKHLGEDVVVIFPDAFKPKRWKHVLRGDGYQNVWLDTHLYQVFGYFDRHRLIDRQILRAFKRIKLIEKLQKAHPVMVGEWSVALPEETTLANLDDSERNTALRTYGAAQLFAQYDAAGWFYWNYKTENGGPWSLRDCVERGWMPNRFD